MLISKKNSLFILFLLVASSTNLCAQNSTWFSLIRSFFASLTSSKTFKRPPFNKRWVGIGALAIGSYVAWKYFKKSGNDKTDSYVPSPEDFTTFSSDEESDEEVEPKPSFHDQLNVGDIVKIIDDTSSIERAPDNIQKNVRILNEKGLTELEQNVKGIYKDYIAIIREKSEKTIIIEMESRKRSKTSDGFSAYFTISQKDVKKMSTQKADTELKKNSYVKVELSPQVVKMQLDDFSLFMHYNNLYNVNFDGQTYYIGFVKEINLKNKTASISCPFHWRGQCPPSQTFTVPISKIFPIYDPDTNQPITTK